MATTSLSDVAIFTIDDTSPTVVYAPFGDTLNLPNLLAGWNPYYDGSGFASGILGVDGEVGVGTSLHVTSRDGASLAVRWHGSGIQLFGKATLEKAGTASNSYSVTLDGAPLALPQRPNDSSFNDPAISSAPLVEVHGLASTLHQISITTHVSPDQIVPDTPNFAFDKAVVYAPPVQTQRKDNDDKSIINPYDTEVLEDDSVAFLGQWTFQNAPTGTAFHISTRAGDRATTTFSGSTLLIHGAISPSAGDYSVTVTPNSPSSSTSTFTAALQAQTLSARSSFTTYDTLLFYATGLDPNVTYSVLVKNEGGGSLSLPVNGFSVVKTNGIPLIPPYDSPPSTLGASSTRHPSKGELAAFVLAGILAFIFIAGGLYFFFVWRPRRKLRCQRLMMIGRGNGSFLDPDHGRVGVGRDSDGSDDSAPKVSAWGRELVLDAPGPRVSSRLDEFGSSARSSRRDVGLGEDERSVRRAGSGYGFGGHGKSNPVAQKTVKEKPSLITLSSISRWVRRRSPSPSAKNRASFESPYAVPDAWDGKGPSTGGQRKSLYADSIDEDYGYEMQTTSAVVQHNSDAQKRGHDSGGNGGPDLSAWKRYSRSKRVKSKASSPSIKLDLPGIGSAGAVHPAPLRSPTPPQTTSKSPITPSSYKPSDGEPPEDDRRATYASGKPPSYSASVSMSTSQRASELSRFSSIYPQRDLIPRIISVDSAPTTDSIMHSRHGHGVDEEENESERTPIPTSSHHQDLLLAAPQPVRPPIPGTSQVVRASGMLSPSRAAYADGVSSNGALRSLSPRISSRDRSYSPAIYSPPTDEHPYSASPMKGNGSFITTRARAGTVSSADLELLPDEVALHRQTLAVSSGGGPASGSVGDEIGSPSSAGTGSLYDHGLPVPPLLAPPPGGKGAKRRKEREVKEKEQEKARNLKKLPSVKAGSPFRMEFDREEQLPPGLWDSSLLDSDDGTEAEPVAGPSTRPETRPGDAVVGEKKKKVRKPKPHPLRTTPSFLGTVGLPNVRLRRTASAESGLRGGFGIDIGDKDVDPTSFLDLSSSYEPSVGSLSQHTKARSRKASYTGSDHWRDSLPAYPYPIASLAFLRDLQTNENPSSGSNLSMGQAPPGLLKSHWSGTTQGTSGDVPFKPSHGGRRKKKAGAISKEVSDPNSSGKGSVSANARHGSSPHPPSAFAAASNISLNVDSPVLGQDHLRPLSSRPPKLGDISQPNLAATDHSPLSQNPLLPSTPSSPDVVAPRDVSPWRNPFRKSRSAEDMRAVYGIHPPGISPTFRGRTRDSNQTGISNITIDSPSSMTSPYSRHPLVSPDSPTDSIPLTYSSEVRFRHLSMQSGVGSEDHGSHSHRSRTSSGYYSGHGHSWQGHGGFGSRRASSQNPLSTHAEDPLSPGTNVFGPGRSNDIPSVPPLPEVFVRQPNAIEREVNRRPFDPTMLVNRVLGIPPSPAVSNLSNGSLGSLSQSQTGTATTATGGTGKASGGGGTTPTTNLSIGRFTLHTRATSVPALLSLGPSSSTKLEPLRRPQ